MWLSNASGAITVYNNVVSMPVGDAGGGPYTDSLGHVWSADRYFLAGTPYDRGTALAIANTVDDRIFQTERFGLPRPSRGSPDRASACSTCHSNVRRCLPGSTSSRKPASRRR